MKHYYLGVDVGSVSTNIVIIDEKTQVVAKRYLRTQGKPIQVLQKGLREIRDELSGVSISGVGVTGSGRYLASKILGADVVKNEITSHAVAALNHNINVSTVLEIGGQDSKIIIIRNGIVVDFAMNTVCAAGTGSFLDRQASRLGINIEEFGKLALLSENPVRIAGRCAVFAESDMIHKQQLGHNQEDIINGLCEALVRNYLNNLAKGKEIKGPVIFQGGVAANSGIKKAFEKTLELEIQVPNDFDVMGSIGAAKQAQEAFRKSNATKFKGFDIAEINYTVKGFECKDCANMCEVIEIYAESQVMARLGDKCGKWTNKINKKSNRLA